MTQFPNLGFWFFRKNGQHLIDETAQQLLQLSSKDQTFDNFISTMDEEDLQQLKDLPFFQLLNSSWQIELRAPKLSFVFKLKSKEPRFIRCSGFVIFEENSPIEVRGFLEDVTEEKLLEEKRLERLTKMALLGELGFSINHETLNPLSVISLCSGHLNTLLSKNEIDRDKVHSTLSVINKAVDKTAKIIKSMRIFNDGQNHKDFEKAFLKEIIEDALELCQDRIRWYDIDLSVDISPDIVFECRSVQVCQIIMNLVMNSILSIKEMNRPWIKIWAQTTHESVKIFVQDSGTGIPSEVASQIMKPFFSTRNGDGTGMGLYLCRNFAHQHGGKLTYDSVSPNTLFVLELPLFHKK